MRLILRFLGALWCACWAIPIWLVYILPLWLIFKDFKFAGWDGPFIATFTLALADPTVEPFHARLWSDWYGIGLPCCYISRDEPGIFDDEDVALVKKHERRHVLQWFIFGPLFPILYVAGEIYGGLKAEDYYNSNPFEVDARRVAGEE